MSAWNPDAIRTLLLYSQDRRGLGHINRTLTIARHILAAYPNFVAYIATRSTIAGNFTIPERCDYIKLPTRLTPVTVQRSEENDAVSNVHFIKLRAQILRDAALMLSPDLVLVDHEPLGSLGEFRDGLYALKAQCPATKFVFGLRDIMDDEKRIRAEWQEMGVYDALENLYDGIAVYGSPNLYDVAQAYAIPTSVRHKLHYCGYITRQRPACDAAALREQYGLPPNGPLVLATVGSGFDGFPVLEASMRALKCLKGRFPGLAALVVTGPLMPVADQSALQAQATPWCRVLSRADNFQLMGAADAIVGMGGYNSVCEALVTARPLVIVPRATHKIEQQIRAETLAAQGLARWVHPKHLDGDKLVKALEWALGCDRQALARRIAGVIPSFNGAARLTEHLSRWLDGREQPENKN
ncbi:MAG TPA: glycosyltransferase [Verrucomicrobiae bacterium]|jgi:predicted glycosyltransferase